MLITWAVVMGSILAAYDHQYIIFFLHNRSFSPSACWLARMLAGLSAFLSLMSFCLFACLFWSYCRSIVCHFLCVCVCASVHYLVPILVFIFKALTHFLCSEAFHNIPVNRNAQYTCTHKQVFVITRVQRHNKH